MWSLGKVIQTPEVCRVYMGSFWEAPLKNNDNRCTRAHILVLLLFFECLLCLCCGRVLLEREKRDLLNEMMALPQNAVVRRINELVKRSRSVKVENANVVFVTNLTRRFDWSTGPRLHHPLLEKADADAPLRVRALLPCLAPPSPPCCLIGGQRSRRSLSIASTGNSWLVPGDTVCRWGISPMWTSIGGCCARSKTSQISRSWTKIWYTKWIVFSLMISPSCCKR